MTDKRVKVPPGFDIAEFLEEVRKLAYKQGVSKEVVDKLILFLGEMLPVKDGRVFLKKQRHRVLRKQIFKEYDGRNLKELMEKYEIGRSTIYRIIKELKKKPT